MLSGVQNTYSAFFWITFKEWDERKAPDEQYCAIKAHMNEALRQIAGGSFARLSATRHPRRGYVGRIHISCWKIAPARVSNS